MVFKDSTLLQEAYISSIQKSVNVPSDTIKPTSDMITGVVGVSHDDSYPESHETCDTCSYKDEEDEEDYMTLSNLFSIFSNAKKLHDFLTSGVKIDEWMVHKIAVCADNLESVMRSTNYDAAKSGKSCD